MIRNNAFKIYEEKFVKLGTIISAVKITPKTEPKVLIKKTNKVVYKTNLFLGYRKIKKNINKIEYQALKNFYNINKVENYFFLLK